MSDNKAPAFMIKYVGIWRTSVVIVAMFSILSTVIGCTKHIATGTTSQKVATESAAATSTTATTLTPASLADSLIGTWKIKRTEIPQDAYNMITYGSQADKDAIMEKFKDVQAEFLSLSTVFKKDKTFQSIFNSTSDVGTWRITDKMEIETTSKTTDVKSTFEVQSLRSGELTVKYGATDMVLLLIFTKQ